MKNLVVALFFLLGVVACNDTDEPAENSYKLKEGDISIMTSSNEVEVGESLTITVTSLSDEGIEYKWMLGSEEIATTKNLTYVSDNAGERVFTLVASQIDISFSYYATVEFKTIPVEPEFDTSAYISKVLDYLPAIGQHVNQIPEYESGDTQEDMNQKVLDNIGGKNNGLITLGGYGGYLVVGFDHTIENRQGLCDFRVYGNAFYAENDAEGGSAEPGIIQVAYDKNKNGVPDDDEWYEIAGSAHRNVEAELWYQYGVDKGLDMNFYSNYEITYTRESKDAQQFSWTDNKEGSGTIIGDKVWTPQFPAWVDADELTFTGSRLPQNAVDEAAADANVPNYVLYAFGYGYADNLANKLDGSAVDIGWAVDDEGNAVDLPGVDFIRIYSGVNQINSTLGECSCDVAGVGDLHILGETINSEQFAK